MKKLVSFALLVALLLAYSTCAMAAIEYKRLKNGNYYGNLSNGKANGYGRWELDTGAIYSGMFLNDAASGFGIYRASSPEIWIQAGIFADDYANLTGVVLRTSGTRLHGTWVDTKYQGGTDEKGYTFIEITLKDGTKYAGEALENPQVITGYGMLTMPDGSQFVGMFQNGLANGTGIQVDSNYNYVLGEWVNGLLVETLETGPTE